VRLRLPHIALPVAFFPRAHLQTPEVLSQGIPYQRGTISLRPARRLIGSLQQLLIENDLDG